MAKGLRTREKYKKKTITTTIIITNQINFNFIVSKKNKEIYYIGSVNKTKWKSLQEINGKYFGVTKQFPFT